MMMNHIQSVLFKQMILHKIFRLIFFIYWTLNTKTPGNRGHRSGILDGFSFGSHLLCVIRFPSKFQAHMRFFCGFRSEKLNRLSYSSNGLILFFFLLWSHWLCLRLTHHIWNCAKAIQRIFHTNNDSTHSKWWWHHSLIKSHPKVKPIHKSSHKSQPKQNTQNARRAHTSFIIIMKCEHEQNSDNFCRQKQQH